MADKKAQSLRPLGQWFVGLVIIFTIIMIYFLMTPEIIIINDMIEPKAAETLYGGKNLTTQVFPKFHRDYAIAPILMIGGVLLLLFMISLKQDPNHPSGGYY